MEPDGLLSKMMLVSFAPLADFYYPLRWFLIAAVVLVLFDLRWGIAAARKRGEIIRRSRAGRRTMNKMLDYVCWVTIAGVFNHIFSYAWNGFFGITIADIPLVQCGLLIFIYAFEIDSCYENYCMARGIKKRWNIFGWLGKKTGMELENTDDDGKIQ